MRTLVPLRVLFFEVAEYLDLPVESISTISHVWEDNMEMTRHALDVRHPMGRQLSHANCRSITEMPGIEMLTYDMDSGHITVTYDPRNGS